MTAPSHPSVQIPAPPVDSGGGTLLLGALALPDAVRAAHHRYEVSVAALEALLGDGVFVPPELERAVLKRKVEFAAGRLCARAALRAAGCVAAADLPIGAHRGPIWPPGYLGSITHCDGTAIAVAAHQADVSAIGLDLEQIMTAETAATIGAQLANAAEIALGRDLGWPAEHWLTLLFSAKESLFKALYPRVGRYFDFLDAQVDAVDAAAARLHLRLRVDLSAQCPAGARYAVRFARDDSRALTCLLLS